MRSLLAVAALACLICYPAQAQNLTYKHWYGNPGLPTFTTPPPPPNNPSATAFTGFPGNTGQGGNVFHKILDDTALHCEIAADFTTWADATIIEGIWIDGGRWGYGKGHFAQAGMWTADFWGITMIGYDGQIGIPAGPHTVDFVLGSDQGVAVQFFARAAVLSCYEVALGVPQ